MISDRNLACIKPAWGLIRHSGTKSNKSKTDNSFASNTVRRIQKI